MTSLSTNIGVTVLKPDMEPIGLINHMTALRWTERFSDIGDFELWAPMTPDNAEMLKENNLLWIGEDAIGIIDTIQETKDTDGSLTMQVSGPFLEELLNRRVVWQNYAATDYVSNHMRTLVNDAIINPSVLARKVPYIVLDSEQAVTGPKVAYNATRGNLWTYLIELGKVHGLSPRFICDVKNRRVKFKVLTATDRSREQSKVTPVQLSSDLSDILSSSYLYDGSGFKNVALIAGQGEGNDRKTAVIGNEESGVDRREIFIDARDISDTETWDYKITTTVSYSTKTIGTAVVLYEVRTTKTKVLTHPTTGETRTTVEQEMTVTTEAPNTETQVEEGQEEVPFADSVYEQMLIERGKGYLTDNVKVQSFAAKVRMTGDRAYTYGEDYFLGDRITIQDNNLRLQISTSVEELERIWDNEGYSITLTLGNAAPTIKQLVLKRRTQ